VGTEQVMADGLSGYEAEDRSSAGAFGRTALGRNFELIVSGFCELGDETYCYLQAGNVLTVLLHIHSIVHLVGESVSFVAKYTRARARAHTHIHAS
jgi:hypothetical protein